MSSHDVLVVEGWQQTPEARGYINALLKRNKRKQPGILERSALLEQFQGHPVLFYRLFLLGKSGVGKTSTVNKICGRDSWVDHQWQDCWGNLEDISGQHEETLGMQISTLLWPAKLVNPRSVVLFHLEFWDSGGRAVNKYDHILPTCKQYTDGTMFFFSYIDRHSWEELPSLMYRTVGSKPTAINVVIGTHADSARREVTQTEVHEFQERTKLLVLPIANVAGKVMEDGKTLDGRAGIEEVTPLMTSLTQILLAYEQQRVPQGMNKLKDVPDEEQTNSPSQ